MPVIGRLGVGKERIGIIQYSRSLLDSSQIDGGRTFDDHNGA